MERNTSFLFSRRMPFNWNSPSGYFYALIIHTLDLILVMEMFTTTVAFFIGFCQFIYAMTTDLKEHFQELNGLVISNGNQFNIEKYRRVKLKFYEIIKFHTATKM